MNVIWLVITELLDGAGTGTATASEQEDVVYRRMRNVDDDRVTYYRKPNEPEE